MAGDICLVDASIYIFRSYFALPDNWHSSNGESVNAVYGYGQFLLNLMVESNSSRIVTCYDESLGQCFRNQIYPQYKANRALPDENLAFQLHSCQKMAELLGVSCLVSSTYEADDLIASAAYQIKRNKTLNRRAIAIVTRDKDLGQLLTRKRDYLWNFSDREKIYSDEFFQKFGVHPKQLTDYLALVGDSIDNIPGVPGIGPKTAVRLLASFGSLKGIFKEIDNIQALGFRGAKTLKPKLIEHLEQIALAKSLATVVDDIDLPGFPACIDLKPINWLKLKHFCDEFGLNQIYKRAQNLLLLQSKP